MIAKSNRTLPKWSPKANKTPSRGGLEQISKKETDTPEIDTQRLPKEIPKSIQIDLDSIFHELQCPNLLPPSQTLFLFMRNNDFPYFTSSSVDHLFGANTFPTSSPKRSKNESTKHHLFHSKIQHHSFHILTYLFDLDTILVCIRRTATQMH